MERILVIGANGQIGSELVEALVAQHGAENGSRPTLARVAALA